MEEKSFPATVGKSHVTPDTKTPITFSTSFCNMDPKVGLCKAGVTSSEGKHKKCHLTFYLTVATVVFSTQQCGFQPWALNCDLLIHNQGQRERSMGLRTIQDGM